MCYCVPDGKSVEVKRGVQKLELTGKSTVQLRAGSETNLTSAGKQNKRTSFRQSLAVCTERAQVGSVVVCLWLELSHTDLLNVHWFPFDPPLVQAGFLNPLLRRTASAKSSLRRAPSALFIEHGKVFQRRKVRSHADVPAGSLQLDQLELVELGRQKLHLTEQQNRTAEVGKSSVVISQEWETKAAA